MLLRMSVENHCSIHRTQELSLIAAPLKGSKSGLISTAGLPNEQILPAAVIYGPNASGKSNFISALAFMIEAVRFSQNRWGVDEGIPNNPFLLDGDDAELASRYEIDFVSDGVRYTYGFKSDALEFTDEWLFSFPEGRQRLLFERKKGNFFKFGAALTGKKSAIKDLVRSNSLFLSAAIQNNLQSLMPVFKFFKDIMLRNSVSSPPQAIYSEFKDSEFDERVMKFLSSIGTGIDGYQQLENDRPEETLDQLSRMFEVLIGKRKNKEKMMKEFLEDNAKEHKVEFSHLSLSGKSVFFDVSKESTGTRRLIPLLVSAFKAIDNGLVLVVDEFDASLHTQICDLILALFNNADINKSGAQLIATTHDTNLLCSQHLRRDQIWLVEKDKFGASELYSLAEVKIRDTDNFEKGYLQGRYGALPFSGSTEQVLRKL